MQKSFEKLMQALKTAPVLAYPAFSKPFLAATDATTAVVGAVLLQLDENGREQLINFTVKVRTKQKRIIRRMKEKG